MRRRHFKWLLKVKDWKGSRIVSLHNQNFLRVSSTTGGDFQTFIFIVARLTGFSMSSFVHYQEGWRLSSIFMEICWKSVEGLLSSGQKSFRVTFLWNRIENGTQIAALTLELYSFLGETAKKWNTHWSDCCPCVQLSIRLQSNSCFLVTKISELW